MASNKIVESPSQSLVDYHEKLMPMLTVKEQDNLLDAYFESDRNIPTPSEIAIYTRQLRWVRIEQHMEVSIPQMRPVSFLDKFIIEDE